MHSRCSSGVEDMFLSLGVSIRPHVLVDGLAMWICGFQKKKEFGHERTLVKKEIGEEGIW